MIRYIFKKDIAAKNRQDGCMVVLKQFTTVWGGDVFMVRVIDTMEKELSKMIKEEIFLPTKLKGKRMFEKKLDDCKTKK